MWILKGNDLTVDAVDIFLTNLLKKKELEGSEEKNFNYRCGKYWF